MTLSRLLSSKYFFLVLLVTFRSSLDALYVIFVSPIYASGYNRFVIDFEFSGYILSWVFFLASVLLVRHRVKRVSDYFFLTALLNVITPLTTLYGLDASRDIFPLLITMLSIYLIAGIVYLPIFPSPKIPFFKNSRKFVIYVSFASIAVLVSWYIVSGAVNNINFDPTKVYDFREDNSKLTDTGIMAYLSIWTYKIFNIFLIMIALHRKNYALVLVLLFAQLFFYGVSAHKAVVFFPLLAISIWYYFRITNLSYILPLGYMGIIILSYLIFVIFENQFIPSLLIRRVFFVPASATYSYFEFFTRNDFIVWGDSILSSLVKYDYTKPLSRVIGDYMNPGGDLGANNGFISRGYAHLGVSGVLLYTLITGYILKVLDGLSKSGVPIWFSLGVTIVPLRTLLVSSDLFTTLLSHGLLIAFLLVVMFRAKKKVVESV